MSRRSPARPRRRRRSKKAPASDPLVVLIVAAAAIGLVVTVVTWLLEHWWILAVAGFVAAVAGGGWLYHRGQRAQWEAVRRRGLRYALAQLDALHHRQFEHAVRDLMSRDGCSDAVQVGGAGDNGADVKATDPFGRRWVIQCKHRRNGLNGSPVGTPDLHVLNGTARQLHGADVVVLVTNGRFTSKCPPLATSQRLHLVDRRLLGEWAGGSQPLWELLNRLPPPRRPS
ncbi:restriction endonuclease [Streptomyces coffeae]|uniref:Restriction endonuclease n=1 Tax=Streptomyces coffeae TaxID=621382 RepID=A0ABS1NGW7_9ACTN|nr:restriction endonuclease [Streptomyces coffeae]MBL1099194.1 restriction endonuclease [Streptomyces coffeae]